MIRSSIALKATFRDCVIMRIAILLSLCCLCLPLWAQDTLETLASRLQQQGAFRAQLFQQKQIAGFKRPLDANGFLIFVPEQGLLYALEQPVQARYRMLPERIDIREGSAPVRHLSRADLPWLQAVVTIFNGALGGQWAQIRQYFDLQFSPGNHWTLVLTPKPGPLQKALQLVTVTGDVAIDEIDIRDDHGDHTVMRLQSLQVATAADHLLLTEVW